MVEKTPAVDLLVSNAMKTTAFKLFPLMALIGKGLLTLTPTGMEEGDSLM